MSNSADNYDFIVVGAGPSAVSAAWPLVLSGKQVLMIDAGVDSTISEKGENIVDLQSLRNGNNADFFLGDDLSKLSNNHFSSPKLRASGENFDQYLDFNKLDTSNFILTGLMGLGGLSRIWGAASACYDDDDLSDSPIKLSDLLPSYIKIANRIGMSGCNSSPISGFIGNQLPLQGALKQTPLITHLVNSYGNGKKFDNFLMGPPLSAVLSKPINERQPCDGDMRCIWGCPKGSIYSAEQEIPQLLLYKNFHLKRGVIVDEVKKDNNNWIIGGISRTSLLKEFYSGNKVLLGMGTFATTRLVMEKFLPKETCLRAFHNPSFSGAMVIPSFLGRQLPAKGYGGSQLCFRIPLSEKKQDYAYGLIFDAASLPAFDLMKHMPFSRYGSINLTRLMLPSLLVLMVYLPSSLSKTYVALGGDNRLKITGRLQDNFSDEFKKCSSKIKAVFRKMGVVSLPGSFKSYEPGAEVHYGCTLSDGGFISDSGELTMASGIYVVDGSSLPALTAKSHTLTIMANADRIAIGLV